MTSSLHFCQTVWSYLVISGILWFVTMYDLNVSRHMLYRAFISSFSVGGRKAITYQETVVFNSWGHLVREYRRILIFKTFFSWHAGNTWFCNLLKSSQKLFLALREEGTCCFVLWKRRRSASLAAAPFPQHFEYTSFCWRQSIAGLLSNMVLST